MMKNPSYSKPYNQGRVQAPQCRLVVKGYAKPLVCDDDQHRDIGLERTGLRERVRCLDCKRVAWVDVVR